ncbi:MAG TPA: Gfo/Idh/MocA family oxidoreductase [Devosiaceae bacterium]
MPAFSPQHPADGRKWKIGIVGAGNISTFHLQAWRNCARAEVVAIADPSRARAAQQAAAFGVDVCYESTAQMLAAEQLDALDILSPRETHAEMVHAAIAAHLPVLCQKPLTNELHSSLELVREAEGSVRLMVNENSRFRPHYRQIGKWIADGRLGEIRQVHDLAIASGFLSSDDVTSPPEIRRQPFFRTEQRMLVAEAMIHHIDTLRSLLGPLTLAYAAAGRISEWVTGEDMASLVFETAGGAPVFLAGNRSAIGMPETPAEEMLIIGTRATIRLRDYTVELLGPSPETVSFNRLDSIQAGFDHAAGHFIACLESGTTFDTAPTDNLETLALVEQIYQRLGPLAPGRRTEPTS